jgi:hypothetical protein
VRSIVGSAAVALDAQFERFHSQYEPVQTVFLGSATIAPFVNEHWQVAFAPGWERNSSGSGTYYSGTAALAANFFLLNPDASSPFVGAFVSANAATRSTGYGAWGGQAGWLEFLSPSLALRTEVRFRRYETPRPADVADALLTFDSFLFGRAEPKPARLPDLGIMDISALADFVFDPNHALTLDLSGAPFLTRWLQIGGVTDFQFLFDENVSQRYLEAFVRGYIPLGTRAAPFADLYTARENIQYGTSTLGMHGARLGVRSYLAPGLALDVSWEWRNSGDGEVERRVLRATLRTQIRVARGR